MGEQVAAPSNAPKRVNQNNSLPTRSPAYERLARLRRLGKKRQRYIAAVAFLLLLGLAPIAFDHTRFGESAATQTGCVPTNIRSGQTYEELFGFLATAKGAGEDSVGELSGKVRPMREGGGNSPG